MPSIASERAAIDKLRAQRPAYPTTLVMAERPPENPRPTFLHNRGEFLQPTERVEPAIAGDQDRIPRDEDAIGECANKVGIGAAARRQGRQIVLLSDTVSSPSTLGIIGDWARQLPNFRHIVYDAVSLSALRAANAECFGRAPSMMWHDPCCRIDRD